jgi:hypothetical protein
LMLRCIRAPRGRCIGATNVPGMILHILVPAGVTQGIIPGCSYLTICTLQCMTRQSSTACLARRAATAPLVAVRRPPMRLGTSLPRKLTLPSIGRFVLGMMKLLAAHVISVNAASLCHSPPCTRVPCIFIQCCGWLCWLPCTL